MEPLVAAAIERHRARVAAAPDSAAEWGAFGRVLHAHGLDEEGAVAYARAGALDPADFRWPYLEGAALKHVAPAEALSAARRAARQNPAYAPAHLLLAELTERTGDSGAALRAWRRALEADPDAALAELGIGRLLLAGGDAEGAAPHLERAASIAPRARPTQAALARLRQAEGNVESARALAAAARALPAEVPVDDPLLLEVWDAAVSVRGVQRRALRAEAAGDTASAEALYDRLLAENPGMPDLRFNFGNFLRRAGRLEDAVRHYEAALDLAPDHVAARVNLGNTLLLLGRRDEARVQLEAALERDPEDPDAHRTLGGLAAYRGDNERAIRHYRAVLAREPGAGEVHRDLAVVLAAEGEFALAWQHVARAEDLGSPPSRDFLFRLEAAHRRPR